MTIIPHDSSQNLRNTLHQPPSNAGTRVQAPAITRNQIQQALLTLPEDFLNWMQTEEPRNVINKMSRARIAESQPLIQTVQRREEVIKIVSAIRILLQALWESPEVTNREDAIRELRTHLTIWGAYSPRQISPSPQERLFAETEDINTAMIALKKGPLSTLAKKNPAVQQILILLPVRVVQHLAELNNSRLKTTLMLAKNRQGIDALYPEDVPLTMRTTDPTVLTQASKKLLAFIHEHATGQPKAARKITEIMQIASTDATTTTKRSRGKIKNDNYQRSREKVPFKKRPIAFSQVEIQVLTHPDLSPRIRRILRVQQLLNRGGTKNYKELIFGAWDTLRALQKKNKASPPSAQQKKAKKHKKRSRGK